MKIYLCYKFSWIEKDVLLQELSWIKAVFDDFGFESFIFCLEYNFIPEAQVLDANFVITKAKEKISEADLVLIYINSPQKSEWMLIEQGIAHALGKKIAVFVKNEIKSNYFLTYGTNPDIIEYDEYADFIDKLKKYLWKYTYATNLHE